LASSTFGASASSAAGAGVSSAAAGAGVSSTGAGADSSTYFHQISSRILKLE
jgi:hypothetical protein